MNKKLRNYFIIGYMLFLGLSTLYVKNVLSHSPIKELQKEDKNVKEVKPVNVSLLLENGTVLKDRMHSVDTVSDFLSELRDQKLIFFEKTLYTYGFELDEVDHFTTPEGYHWRVLHGENDITENIGKINLVDNAVYTLKLVKR